MKRYISLSITILFCLPSLLWAQTVEWNVSPGYTSSLPVEMLIDANENIYICGGLNSGVADFDPDTSNSVLVQKRHYSSKVLFVAKYDSSSNLQWVRTMHGSKNGVSNAGLNIRSMKMDKNGNIHISGTFNDSIFFGQNLTDTLITSSYNNINNVFWAMYDQNGNFIWVRKFADTIASYIRSMDISDQGDFVFLGEVLSTIDLDFSSATNFVNHDTSHFASTYLVVYDQYFNFKWSKVFYSEIYGCPPPPCLATPLLSYCQFDNSGNIIIHGTFQDSLDADPGSNQHMLYAPGNWTATEREAFYSKFDQSGNFVNSIAIDANGIPYLNFKSSNNGYNIFGTVRDTTDLDPSSSSAMIEAEGMFIAQYDSNLNYISHISAEIPVNSTSIINLTDLLFDANNNPTLIGSFRGSYNFNFTGSAIMHTSNNFDVFIAKYSPDFEFQGMTVIGDGDAETSYNSALGSDSTIYIYASARNFSSITTTDVEPGPDTVEIEHNQYSWWLAKYRKGPKEDTSVALTICPGDSVLLQGAYRDTAGIYIDSLYTYLLGDSLVYTQLIIDTIGITYLNLSICTGDSVLIGGQFRFTPGIYYDTLSNFYGCDSILEKNLTLLSLPQPDLGNDVLACDGSIIEINIGHPAFANFIWNNNSFDSLYTSTFMEATSDTIVWVRVVDTSGCIGSDTLSLLPNNLGPIGATIITENGLSIGYRATMIPEKGDSWYWNFGDGQKHIGDTNVLHTYSQNGIYLSCLVVENECDKDSTCLGVTLIVGISEGIEKELKIYPNPVENEMYIEMNENLGSMSEIKVLSDDGALVILNITTTGHRATLDLSTLQNGTYILVVTTENEMYHHKFIKIN